MLYVDDRHYDRSYFDRCFSLFDAHPVLGGASAPRVAARFSDSAFWLALCWYMKGRGGTVFPLPFDAPREAARRRAERAKCEYLFFGEGEDALEAAQPLQTSDEMAFESSEPSLIQMSSGTTGQPKVVERPWSDIEMEVEHYVRDFVAAESTTPLVAAPVTHSYGLISGVMAAVARGEQPSIISSKNPKYILRKVREAEAPLLFSSPTLIKTLCMLIPAEQRIFSVMTSGTTMQRAWFESVARKVAHLHQQYGCSEAGCVTVGANIQEPSDLGVPLSHLKVSTSESAAAPGPIVVELSGGGIVETGDLGYFEGGRLRFVARMDDMINVAGFNVYPAEVEDVVLEMPEISDAVVFRKPHRLGHQEVALQFVSDREVPSEAIRAFCAARLTNSQVPMSIARVPAIPKLPNGKISRKALSEA